MGNFTITFKPQNKKINVGKGTDLLTAAFKAGIILNSTCGGEGVCGKCKVIVRKGSIKTEPSRDIDERERKKKTVLACETIAETDLEVMIPPSSLAGEEKAPARRIEAEEFTKGIISERERSFKHSPLVKKIYLELSPPTIDDNISDLDRICRKMGAEENVLMKTRLANVKHLGDVLRENDFKVTVAVADKENVSEIIAIESGNTTDQNYGFAFDIGTTTVTGQLVDLEKREILGTRIAYNRQARYGSDVITRIIHGSEPEGLRELNAAVLDNLNEMIGSLVKANKIDLTNIYAVVFAGNTTMMHLLLKIDPSHIRKEPYVPTVAAFPVISSAEIGLKLNPRAYVFCLPGVSTYIGGDAVSGVLSSGLSEAEELTLLVDIGTNGEIVLGNREWMMACAASAGPAFEGSGLSAGMKAVKGAIQKARIDERFNVKFEQIGAGKPKGICGSAYIDILSEMLRHGLIDRNGKMNTAVKSDRIRTRGAGHEFIVARREETEAQKAITISEEDIENLKRSKGAIYSAIMSLLNKVGKAASDLKKVYIAGGFGSYLDIENSIAIGLLPDIERSHYEFIGNSSIAGARLSIFSSEAFSAAHEIYRKIMYLDLSTEPQYMDEYVAALFFPHTELGRFPSARSSR